VTGRVSTVCAGREVLGGCGHSSPPVPQRRRVFPCAPTMTTTKRRPSRGHSAREDESRAGHLAQRHDQDRQRAGADVAVAVPAGSPSWTKQASAPNRPVPTGASRAVPRPAGGRRSVRQTRSLTSCRQPNTGPPRPSMSARCDLQRSVTQFLQRCGAACWPPGRRSCASSCATSARRPLSRRAPGCV